jgi:hypothetical protein
VCCGALLALCHGVADARAAPPQSVELAAGPPAGPPEPPGSWELHPARLVSGSEQRIELRYVHGDAALPAGSSHVVFFEPLSVQDLEHARPSTDVELVPLGEAAPPRVLFEALRVSGLGDGELVLRFPDGLRPGERFALRYGNRGRDGAVVGRVAPIPARALTFRIETSLGEGGPHVSWLNRSWGAGLPTVDIVAGAPSRVRLFGPSLVECGAEFRLRIAVTDAFDSRPEPPYAGLLELDAAQGPDGLPATFALSAEAGSHAELEGLRYDAPGNFRIRARLGAGGAWFESHPIVVRERVEEHLAWGSLHNHTLYSEGWGDDLATTFAHAREMAGFDFFSLSDHCDKLPGAQLVSRLASWRQRRVITAEEAWQDTLRTSAAFHEDGRFVTLLGYELSMSDAGHYNVYWNPDDEGGGDPARYFLRTYNDYLVPLQEHLARTGALLLPHKHAATFPYQVLTQRRNDAGEEMVPAIEIYSDWGEAVQPVGARDPEGRFGALRSGLSYLWALDQGHMLGLVADADHHGGVPGRRQVFGVSPTHDHPQGITAAWLPALDRASVFAAYRGRRTYGTTGERMFLDVGVGADRMGSVHHSDADVELSVEFAGTAPIEAVRVFDGQRPVGVWSPDRAGQRDAVVPFRLHPWTHGPPADAPPVPPRAREGRLGLTPGSPEELHYVARDDGSKLTQGARFTDRQTSIVYGFLFAAGEPAAIEVDIDQQFRVSVSHDGLDFEVLLEDDRDAHGLDNRALRTIDLGPHLRADPRLFLKFQDSRPEDGWGARFRGLTLRCARAPSRLEAPDLDIRFRPAERRRAYVVEVTQADGQRAWSSPLWVERRSLPDLRWLPGDGGAPVLVNDGTAPARAIEVSHSATEHGALLASVPGPHVQRGEQVLCFWTERFDDRRARVHVRWFGAAPLEGSLRLEGATGYETRVNRESVERGGRHEDRRDGTVVFRFPAAIEDDFHRAVGLDVQVENDATRPVRVVARTERDVVFRLGGSDTAGAEFRFGLNGRTSDGPLPHSVVPVLEPGATWQPDGAGDGAGAWLADPEDAILERDEDNNLWIAPAGT